jgi:outer membrane usher protein
MVFSGAGFFPAAVSAAEPVDSTVSAGEETTSAAGPVKPSSSPSPSSPSSPSPGHVEFVSDVLQLQNQQVIDIKKFSSGEYIVPGKYQASVRVNGEFTGSQEIEVKSAEDNSSFVCISPALLKIIPLSWDAISETYPSLTMADAGCSDVLTQIADTEIQFDSGEQRLDLSIPQKFIRRQARGSISPALWDSGIPAGFLSYDLSSWTSQSAGYNYKSLYASLNSGVNIGAWYFRHNGAWTWTEGGVKEYRALNSYLQRDIPSLMGRMLLGQSGTTGRLFDTVPFSGVQLASDERMYPESRRGYAPEVRGIARTNARVTVRQNNQIIYETTVSPGPFVIDDLYPTGFGGDLAVTVQEADGQKQYFLVPYSSMPQLLRPGAYRYSVTAGHIRQTGLSAKPRFLEATWQQGLMNALTGYAGWQYSEGYYAGQLGAALGTLAGAFSFDVTQSHTTPGHGSRHDNRRQNDTGSITGQSYRLSYSKVIQETGTSISLAAYRFSTDGYYDLSSALAVRERQAGSTPVDKLRRARHRYTLTSGQSLPGRAGQLYASASFQSYWNSDDRDKQFQVGYSNSWNAVSYGLNISRSYSGYGKSDTSWLLTLSFPLGSVGDNHVPVARLDAGHNADGSFSESASLSGTAGKENQYSYGATARNSSGHVGSSLYLNGQWRTSHSHLNASAGMGQHYQSQSLGASGSLIVHSGGVTFSPYTSDTWALIEARGAKGARVSSYAGVYVDRYGYAAVPYLEAYRLNEVSIDPKDAENDIGFESTSRKVAPYSGAIVKVKYDTETGLPLLLNATWKGEPVPFGADVADSDGNYLATVGQSGLIFLRAEPGHHRLTLRAGGQGTCRISIDVPAEENGGKMRTLPVVCH